MKPCIPHPQRAGLLAILIISMLSACSETPNEPTFPDTSPILESTFREAVDRYLNEWSVYEFITFAQTSWIPFMDSENELGNIAPSLLRKLDGLKLPVRPYSECVVKMGVKHPDFSGKGICIWVANVTFTSRQRAVVYAGYYGDAMGAAGELYELRCEACRWTVVNVRRLFVS